ncbi:MAG: MFS transporter [Paludisphaera borealis]|uniref:MFS transporter n=1 Tax=Paludisphaera borealis TaxID=1387353 RepID=UPI00284C03C9|nr:MFS transporter [Paludisphaera borealis]MDR3618117.1 MFS transporter [Paludisphaera borealis]
MFASLAQRDYRLYFMGQGVSLIGTWLQAAAVRWLVYEQTRSEFLLGVVEVANLMPGLLIGLFSGAVSDRVAPRAMIVTMEFGQMACAFLLAALVGLGIVQFWQMVVILALARICVSFELPSRQVFLYDLVGTENLSNAIALNAGLFNATRVIGPALAGVGISVLGAAGCFTVNAVSYLAAIAAVFAIQPTVRPDRARGGKGAAFHDVLAGLAYLRGEPRLVRHLALMGFFGLMGMGYESMTPAYARRVVGAEVGGYSLILACGGAGATVGALTVARLGHRRHKDRLVVVGLLIFSTFLLAASLYPYWVPPTWPLYSRIAAAACCLLGAGFGAAMFYASTQTLIQLTIPDHLRGRIMGVWMVIFSGTVPLGALWTGRAASIWGVTRVMSVSAVVCIAVGLFLRWSGALAEAPKQSARAETEPPSTPTAGD